MMTNKKQSDNIKKERSRNARSFFVSIFLPRPEIGSQNSVTGMKNDNSFLLIIQIIKRDFPTWEIPFYYCN
jgi:hypothetical protein